MNRRLTIALKVMEAYRDLETHIKNNNEEHSDYYQDDIELIERLESEGLLIFLDEIVNEIYHIRKML